MANESYLPARLAIYLFFSGISKRGWEARLSSKANTPGVVRKFKMVKPIL